MGGRQRPSKHKAAGVPPGLPSPRQDRTAEPAAPLQLCFDPIPNPDSNPRLPLASRAFARPSSPLSASLPTPHRPASSQHVHADATGPQRAVWPASALRCSPPRPLLLSTGLSSHHSRCQGKDCDFYTTQYLRNAKLF